MGNIARRPDGKWRARYRDSAGRERTKQFVRKVDAHRWLSETSQALLEGRYVDPQAGRITLHEYAQDWMSRQVHRPTTADQTEGVVHRYIDPRLGGMRLAAIESSDVQKWVKELSLTLAPSTVGVAHLWPDNDERTRAAVNGVLHNFADLLRTNGGVETHHRRSEG